MVEQFEVSLSLAGKGGGDGKERRTVEVIAGLVGGENFFFFWEIGMREGGGEGNNLLLKEGSCNLGLGGGREGGEERSSS